MSKVLVKIDKNGSKHYDERVKCDRCDGTGVYKWGAIINGRAQYAGVCYKCDGAGTVVERVIERTPEYQAKLDARRAKREEKRRAEYEKAHAEQLAREAKEEAERKAREEAERARKAVSQYVGEVGDKLDVVVTLERRAWFEVDSFRGYGKDTVNVYTFKDDDGNALVWKTSAFIDNDEGERVRVKGRVKSHDEYRDEKQTYLSRCKVAAV